MNPSGTVTHSDVCINGMFLAVAAYFGAGTPDLTSVVDFIVGEQLGDGGFNCRSNRSGCRVSSVHTTTSVIDGLTEYLRAGHAQRADDVRIARDAATECLLVRHLYQQRATGVPVHPEVVKLHHPPRWRFDVLRGLEVVSAAGIRQDARLQPALEVLRRRRRADGRWAANAGYPGATHVTYARAGTPHPWVTLRALRVMRALSAL